MHYCYLVGETPTCPKPSQPDGSDPCGSTRQRGSEARESEGAGRVIEPAEETALAYAGSATASHVRYGPSWVINPAAIRGGITNPPSASR